MAESEEETKTEEATEDGSKQLKITVKYEREQQLTVQCLMSFAASFSHSSGLPKELHGQNPLNGFTGRSFRHLLNNLCKMKGCTYLEVGTFCGSSLISALFGNHDTINKAYAIDNWSEFREHVNPEERFNQFRNAFIPEYTDKLEVIEGDCFSLDLSQIKDKIDVYFYDGGHAFDDHKRAFTYFNDVFNDTFIAIIDDWEKSKVQDATHEAFKELDYKVLAQWEIVPPEDRENRMDKPDMNWWHGISMFVVKK